ncbi:MAG: GntR family transcriptional regulator [Sporolactobacillus sp.]
MAERPIPVPAYYRIEQYLEQLIDQRQLTAGDRMPSERELTERFHVSRMTVRQALNDLVGCGLLIRQRGKGTFLADARKLEKKLNKLNGFSEDMRQRGLEPDSHLLDFQKIAANAGLSQILNQKTAVAVFLVKRLRLADGLPMALETSFVPEDVAPALNLETLGRSLYDYLSRFAGVVIDHAVQTIEAAVATHEESELLGIAEQAPLLLIKRRAFDNEGRCLEFTKSLYRGDRYKFLVTLPG